MVSRREMVTAGLLGSLAAGTEVSASETSQETQALRDILKDIDDTLGEIKTSIDQGLRGNSMTFGNVGQLRSVIEKYSRAAGKFPEYCEVGLGVFYDVYDWHVRQQQQVQVTRIAEQRFMILFMFTQLIVRWENDTNYIGVPYDR
ncbi:MAG TPA: hypothetical protein VF491_20500 [Vicinamibacterales bacterium]